jgi:membrane protein DedA with SNARE-associated domain
MFLSIFEHIGEIIQDMITTIGYPGITLVMFLENVFPPIPSELVLPFAGFLVSEGDLNFWGVWIASIIGSLVGAITLYKIGEHAGDPIIRAFLRRYGRWITVSEKDYDRALNIFRKYGEIMIFVGRLIPIIRSIISVPAGAEKMPMPKFLLLTTLGSALWNGILIYAGIALGDNWERAMQVVEDYQQVTVVIIIVLTVIFVGWWIYSKLRARSEASTITPPPTPTVEDTPAN